MRIVFTSMMNFTEAAEKDKLRAIEILKDSWKRSKYGMLN